MRELMIDARDADKRLDRYLAGAMPGAGAGQIQKLIRQKEIKVNGRPGKADTRLEQGDRVRIFAPEAAFEAEARPDPFLSKFRHHIQAAYEDGQILIADKRPGLVVHGDDKEKVDTLVNHARAYLYQKGEYDPLTGFAPTPCNRIDRFTGGLVILAKTREALEAMDGAIRAHRVDKEYILALRGVMKPEKGRLVSYMIHEGKGMKVLDARAPGAQQAVLEYSTLYRQGGMSLASARLLTGRTHQIRAQFAHAGHPLVGDGQYGDPRREGASGLGYQALYAWRLGFHFEQGPLAYLDGKQVHSARVPFVAALFPDYRGEIGR